MHPRVGAADIVVVGAGIVGLAAAREILTRHPGLILLVLEKEARIAAHQTGHNSGVIHAGIYYKPGSLKARLCVRGARLMREYADASGIPYSDCGKLIVAVSDAESPRLQTLWKRGQASGVPGLRYLSGQEAREIEPAAMTARAAIHSPHTGIIDYGAVSERLARDITALGGQILTGAKVIGLDSQGGERTIETTAGPIGYEALINCAGLQADRVARMLGARPEARIVPFRGEYYAVREDRCDLVRGLLYPAPHPSFPFLGVHFTRLIDGGLKVGPNAVLACAREGYNKSDFRALDLAETLAYPGFIRLVARHWRTGAGEIARSVSKAAYARALQRLVPDIRASDFGEYGSGVRAQCVAPDGSLLDDFYFLPAEHAMHVLNVPSPAATASLAIAEMIADMASGMIQA